MAFENGDALPERKSSGSVQEDEEMDDLPLPPVKEEVKTEQVDESSSSSSEASEELQDQIMDFDQP